jgi:hypothetical protein
MKTIYKILIALVIATGVTIYLIDQLSTPEGRFLLSGKLPANSECVLVASELSTDTPLTVTCDAYHTDDAINDGTPMESAALAIKLTVASTTDSDADVNLSYSQNGTDWYEDRLVSEEAMASTTTLTSATTSEVGYIYNVLTPTRYIKATFSTDGEATSTVSAQFIPKK